MLKKIVITGGDGRFAQILKKDNNKLNIFYPGKKELMVAGSGIEPLTSGL